MKNVLDELRKRNLRISFRFKRILKNNFYAHEMFGEELIPLKNIIYDVKNGTKTSLITSKYKALKQVNDQNGVFEVIWENTREPFENIDYSVFKTFTDFKKVFTEITDEGKLKEIYDDQKKQDRELVYKPIEDEKIN